MISGGRYAVYFVFLLETVQTALTGSDVYYWFISGFGNVERLSHSHFAPIDIAFISAAISLLVQGYFCYRIWVMNNKRLSWICWIISVVSIPGYSRILQASDAFLNTECGDSISRINVAGYQGHFYAQFYVNLLSYTAFRQSWLGSMWIPGRVIMYAHSFWLKWPYYLSHFRVSYGQYRVPWRTF